MATRRNILKLIGGGAVLAAAGTGGFVATNQPSHAARAAWRSAGKETEFRRRALSYAILAPNPHNRQPWLVKLEGNNALTLYCDLDRRLPDTDPLDRQITIGHGAFLELLPIAAAQDGYRTNITPFPQGENMETLDGRPVATVEFTADQTIRPDPLFRHILDRRSNKEVYEDRNVEQALLRRLETAGTIHGVAAQTSGTAKLVSQLRDLTWRGHRLETRTPRTMQESIDLMRIGSKQVSQFRDGISMEGPMMEAAKLAGIMTPTELADPKSTAFRQGLDMFKEKAMSARAFGWLSNDNQNRADQINAGRAYARFNLQATAMGLAIHPWSQSLQEFPEMASLHQEVHNLIGGGKRLQMLVRIGYAPDIIAAPRRGMDALIPT